MPRKCGSSHHIHYNLKSDFINQFKIRSVAPFLPNPMASCYAIFDTSNDGFLDIRDGGSYIFGEQAKMSHLQHSKNYEILRKSDELDLRLLRSMKGEGNGF